MDKLKGTDKYKFCNHHHELTKDHELVNIGGEEFVANKDAIPLLKALNELGLKTRSHHIGKEDYAWFTILIDKDVDIRIVTVNEGRADRTKYNGKVELQIMWKRKKEL